MLTYLNKSIHNKNKNIPQNYNSYRLSMAQSLESKLQSPTLQQQSSNGKLELKKVDDSIHTTRNRIALLRQQLLKQKQAIKKNKNLTKEILDRKISIHQQNMHKQRDNSQELELIEERRKKNKSMRLQHERSLQKIQKAIYLVKLDDARQIKNITQNHRKKMKELESQNNLSRSMRKKSIQDQNQKAKQRKKQYWKERLSSIYEDQILYLNEMNQRKDERLGELKSLQEEEIKLMEEINKRQSQQIQAKKEYYAAMSLPSKAVAEALGSSQSANNFDKISQKKMTKNSQVSKSMNFNPKDELKIPSTQINPVKLKIILQELKKMQKAKKNRQSE